VGGSDQGGGGELADDTLTWRPFGSARLLQSRVARQLAVRQADFLARPLWLGRVMTLPVLVTTFSASEHRLPALACAVPALLMIAWRATERRPFTARVVEDEEGQPAAPDPVLDRRQRTLRDLLTWVDMLSAQLLVFASTWLIPDLARDIQLGSLLAAEVLLIVIALGAVLNPDWYRPGEPYSWFVDWCRAWAGPIIVALSSAIAFTGSRYHDFWSSADRAVMGAITLSPLMVTALTHAQNELIMHVSALIRQEAQDGRQVVLDETHGAVSTTLRLLEQRARDERERSPRLYELAVVANSGLRETLTLADPDRESAQAPETLRAVVSTLALAVGAGYNVRIEVGWLGTADRNAARVVLNELVGLVLNAGAMRIEVLLTLQDNELMAMVETTAPRLNAPMPADGSASPADCYAGNLAWLRSRLAQIGGAAEVVVLGDVLRLSTRWPARPGTEPMSRRMRWSSRRRLLNRGRG
jgi:hypothetical protein